MKRTTLGTPFTAAAWTVQKRRAVAWFAAVAAGVWIAHAASLRAGLGLLGAAAVLGILWMLRRRPDGQWGLVFLVTIASLASLATAHRLEEYARWEVRYPRGDRRTLRAQVVDVLPYGGDRIALLARDLEVRPAPGAGPLWVRIVAPADDVLGLLDRLPPGEDGTVRWPVRVYPFSPRGNPGEFDARMWAMRHGYLATVYPEAPPGDADDSSPEGFPDPYDPCTLSEAVGRIYRELGLSSRLRETAWRWRCRLTRGKESDAAAVAVAMLLGQKDLLGTELQEAFSRSGLGHLLAVSGLHVGFLLTLVFPLVRRTTGLSRRPGPGGPNPKEVAGYFLLCAVVFGFVGLTGAPPSAVRAGVTAAAGLGAATLRRPLDGWQTLGVAGSALLLAQPLFLFDLGFQMSFLAVAGILVAVSLRRPGSVREERASLSTPFPAARPLGRVVRLAVDSLAITLGAQVAVAPVVAYAFSSFSWVSPFVNLVGVPVGGAAVALLAAGVVAGEVWPWLGDRTIALGHFLLEALIWLARAVAPWGAVEVAMPSAAAVVGWYGLWFGGALYVRSVCRPSAPWMIRLSKGTATAGAVLLAVSLIVPAVKGMLGVAEVWVLDVGQGDSVVIRSGWGQAVIVDGGGVPGAAVTGGFDVGERRVVPALKKLGVRRLQAVINTHPHEDHAHGLRAVVASRRVDAVYASAADSAAAAYRVFIAEANRKGLDVQRLAVGQTLWLEPELGLTVLAGGDMAEWVGSDRPGRPSLNDRSVALLLRHPKGTMLLLGDLEERGQRRVLSRARERPELSVSDVDILLVPHHGDAATVASGLLDVTRPKAAIISVGPNGYGHPSQALLDELASRGIRWWRTDRHGAVRIEFWPWGVRVTGLRGGPEKGGKP